jgi:serine/threonine-protein kinase
MVNSIVADCWRANRNRSTMMGQPEVIMERTSPAESAATEQTQAAPPRPIEPTIVQTSGDATEGELGAPINLDRTLRQEDFANSMQRRPSDTVPAATGSRYRVLSLHARGGLGVVYVAEDTELRRRVALKEIQVRHAHDARSRQRFNLEAEITGRLAHPGIVPVHGLGQHDDGRPFYAMRFVEGETLLDAIERFHRGKPADRGQRRLALRQLLKHFLDVCNAVAYAHSQGVIHRDLKPSNVLLGKFGETLLVDWGLAKYLGVCQSEPTALTDERSSADQTTHLSGEWTLPTEAATEMGAVIGTPAYMSPEQAAGNWDEVSIASDVYSLGAMLYMLLTGTPPLPKRAEPSEWLTVPLGGIATPLSLNPSAPPALAAMCRKAMAPRAAERYAGALDLAADVEHWLADEPVQAMPEGMLTRAGRWARRHLAIVSGVSAAVLVLGISLAVGVGLLANANRQITQVNDQLVDSNKQLTNANEQIRSANRLTVKAVDELFTDVSENPRLLRKEPGTQELRKALLERARNYYEGFLHDRADDASLQIETAAAYFRLAVIQEELEPGPRALESYRKAESMRAALAMAAPADRQRVFDLAVSRNHLGKMLQDMGKSDDALAMFNKARDKLATIAEEHPEESKYSREWARVLDNIGVTQHVTGHGADALKSTGQARRILEQLTQAHPNDADIAKEYSTALGILGALQRLGGQPAEAVETLSSACGILDRLMRENPDRTEFAQDLAQSTNLLAIALGESNRKADALAAYDRSRVTREKLVRENPGVAEYAQELAVTFNNISTVLRALNRLDDAVKSAREALRLQSKLVADHPDLPDYSQDLARTHNNLGILLADLYRYDGALAEYVAAKAIQQKLAQAQPQNIELAQELAKCCHNLGRLYVDLGRLDDGGAALEQGRAIREKLAATKGASPLCRAGLVETLLALADLARDHGRPADALQLAQEARAASSSLPSEMATPLNRAAWQSQAIALSLLGRHTDSFGAWDESLKLADPPAKPLLQLGRIAARLRSGDRTGLDDARSLASDPNASPIVLFESARVFAIAGEPANQSTALDLLTRAGKAGWFRIPTHLRILRNDADFESVRRHSGFDEWLKTIQK